MSGLLGRGKGLDHVPALDGARFEHLLFGVAQRIDRLPFLHRVVELLNFAKEHHLLVAAEIVSDAEAGESAHPKEGGQALEGELGEDDVGDA